MADVDIFGDWKPWAIKLGFGLFAALLPITLALVSFSYSTLKSELKSDVSRIEVIFEKHLAVEIARSDKQEARFEKLCQQVGEQSGIIKEHDILLRQPWLQRKEFFLYQKNNRGTP